MKLETGYQTMTETGGTEILSHQGWKKRSMVVEHMDEEGVQGEMQAMGLADVTTGISMISTTIAWEEERALWIQKKMQRIEPIDEEGWNAAMENLCLPLFR